MPAVGNDRAEGVLGIRTSGVALANFEEMEAAYETSNIYSRRCHCCFWISSRALACRQGAGRQTLAEQ